MVHTEFNERQLEESIVEADDEQIIQEISNSRAALTAIYTILGVGGAFFYRYRLADIRAADAAGKLSPMAEHFLHHFLDYIGNNYGTVVIGIYILIFDLAISLTQKLLEEKTKLVDTLEIVRPMIAALLFILAFYLNIDAEVDFLQTTFLTQGEPHVLDAEFGLFGLLTSLLMFDFYSKQFKPRFLSRKRSSS